MNFLWGLVAGAVLVWLGTRGVARVVQLATLWMVLAILPYSFITYMSRVPSRHTYLASAVPALLSKESAYAFPLIAALWLWMDGVRGREFLRLALPPFAAVALVFAYRWTILRGIAVMIFQVPTCRSITRFTLCKR